MRTRIVDGVLEVHVAQAPYPHRDELPHGGWLSTHDLISQDPATGMLRLRGRHVPTDTNERTDTDLMRIETVLRTHEKVSAAVVVGGTELDAHVAGPPELDAFELMAWCKQFLAEDTMPTRYHLLPELPRTGNGKFVRSNELLLAHGARVRAGTNS